MSDPAYHRLVIGIAPADALAMLLGNVHVGLALEATFGPAERTETVVAAWASFEPEPANIIQWRYVCADAPSPSISLDLAINGVTYRTPLIAIPATLAIYPDASRDEEPLVPRRALRLELDADVDEAQIAFERTTNCFYLHAKRKNRS